jgi:hypothetical protein
MSASRLGGGGAPPRPTHFDLGDDAPVCIFWSFGSSRSAPRGGGGGAAVVGQGACAAAAALSRRTSRLGGGEFCGDWRITSGRRRG